jgi:C4-dicarboxylate-specific signal transduction histidine kinase/CheY-like chemotaxis protein
MRVKKSPARPSARAGQQPGWLAALDLLGQGFAVFDRDLRLVVCNARFGLLRAIPEDLCRKGAPLEDIVRFFARRGDYGPGDIETLVNTAIAPSREARAQTVERHMPDGRVILVEMRPVPAGGMLIAYSDVSNLRRHEQELQRARESADAAVRELHVLLDTVEYGILFLDADLRIRIANRAYRQMWQFPAGFFERQPSLREDMELTRDRGLYVIPDNDWESYYQERVAAIRTGDIAPTELRVADGRVVQYQCIALPAGGRMLTYFDITALHEARVMLEQKVTERTAEAIAAKDAALAAERVTKAVNERFFAAAESMADGLAIYDPGGRLVYFNSRYPSHMTPSERPFLRLGEKFEVLLRNSLSAGPVFHDDMGADYVERRLALYRQPSAEHEQHLPDGRWLRLRENAMPGGGRVILTTDITEVKQAEAEVVRQRAALVQSEKMSAFGSLLAGVAHELNNPLSIVVAQAALLQESARDPEVLTRSKRIETAAERCAKIVRTFLAMARRRPPARTEIDLNEIVRAALDVLAYGLRSSGIDVRRELDPALPVIHADGDQLHQVATNLLLNAQQAMMDRPGTRRLRVATEVDRERMQVRLVVDDTGPGVPKGLHQKIFEPFFTTKPAGSGLGFGLSLCHGLVESHGGQIAVEDAPGGGARFIVSLPYTAAPAKREPVKPAAPTPAHKGRILVVDDETDIADTCGDILAMDGHRCDFAMNGRAALERVAQGCYDLILSDLRMPQLDGPGFYRELSRSHPQMAERIIFLTGDTLSPAIQTFLAESKRPYIEKPLDPKQLREAVAAALARYAANPA